MIFWRTYNKKLISKKGNKTITIIQREKYESLTIILFFLLSSFINKPKDKEKRKESKKIKKIIKYQNDFEIPEENSTVQNIVKNHNFFINEENKYKSDNEESDSNSISEINEFETEIKKRKIKNLT